MRGTDPRRTRRTLGLPIAVLGGALLAFVGRDVAASEVRTVTRTLGEGYMVRVPGPGGQLLGRRRIVQYVHLGVYRLLPPRRPQDGLVRRPEDGQLEIVTSLRLRHDFGDFMREASGTARQLLESLDGRQIDLLYGYLEGQRIGNVLDFRIGRQFEFSGLDFYAFDGAWARVRLPVHLAIEAFGGFQVDGSAVFGYPTFEFDGTQGRALDRQISPMVGVAAALDGLTYADARVAYRRTWSPARLNPDAIDPEAPEGTVDHEVLSAQVAFRFAQQRVTPFAALRYNLGVARIDDVSAGLGVTLTPKHSLRAFYLRAQPVFDLDSIFNVFAFDPLDDVRLVYELRPSERWTIAGRTQLRFEHARTTAALGTEPTTRTGVGAGGGLAASYRRRRFALRLDGYGHGGMGAMRVGASVDTRTHVFYDRIAIDARTYGIVTRVSDHANVDGSVAVQVGTSVRLTHGIVLHVVGEELVSTTLRHAFRLFGTFSLDWAFRVGGR